MKSIPLTQARVALVDDEDFAELMKWKWTKCQNYAGRTIITDGKQVRVLMHRVITRAQPGEYVDHINGNSLDNRKSNLRLVTHQQNTFNRGKSSNNRSGYKGVFYNSQHKMWQAKLHRDGKAFHGGFHYNRNAAARAYNRLALELHGEYAALNIIDERLASNPTEMLIATPPVRKTHCLRGHELSASNLVRRRDIKRRECRICANRRATVRRLKK